MKTKRKVSYNTKKRNISILKKLYEEIGNKWFYWNDFIEFGKGTSLKNILRYNKMLNTLESDQHGRIRFSQNPDFEYLWNTFIKYDIQCEINTYKRKNSNENKRQFDLFKNDLEKIRKPVYDDILSLLKKKYSNDEFIEILIKELTNKGYSGTLTKTIHC